MLVSCKKRPVTNALNDKQTIRIDLTSSSTQHTAQLGQILVYHRWINEAQLASILMAQRLTHTLLGQLLVEQRFISEEQLKQALQEQYWRKNGYWVI